MEIPLRDAVRDVAGRIRGLKEKFGWLGKVYWKENIVWSPGYVVSTVGVDEDQILKYVRLQGHPVKVKGSLIYSKVPGACP